MAIYNDAKWLPQPPKFRHGAQNVAFNDRSLMPSVRRGTKASGTPREDGLVYLEQHPTDPNRVVAYYSDEMGTTVTPREMSRAEYDRLIGNMSDADKAQLASYAEHYQDKILDVRLEREYDRLTDLGKQHQQLQIQLNQLNNLPQAQKNQQTIAQGTRLQNQMKELDKQAQNIAGQLQRAQNLKNANGIMAIYNDAKWLPQPPKFRPHQ